MTRVALISGLCVIGAYLLGSIPTDLLRRRGKLRRDLRRLNTRRGTLEVQLRLLLAGVGNDPDRPPPAGSNWGDLAAAALDTLKVLAAATITWHVIEHYSPGHGHVRHFSLGAIAFSANQVLLGQQSAALWAGLAAAAGHLASPWLRFRSGQGQAPILALTLVYSPLSFSAGVFGFFLALAVVRNVPRAVFGGLAAFVGYTWLGWAFDWRHSWGASNGPELTLWAAALAALVAARTWPDVAAG